jgi:hypothetical protein
MTNSARRVVTGHDAAGKSVVLSDGPPPQHHPMHGPAVGADFMEMWSVASAIPKHRPVRMAFFHIDAAFGEELLQ